MPKIIKEIKSLSGKEADKFAKKMLNMEKKKVKCIYCHEPIPIKDFGGITKRGMFCNNYFCIKELSQEMEEQRGRR